MTPRERVLQALRHKEPDRIPVDLCGMESSGITAIAYNALRKHLGLGTGKTKVFDVFCQTVLLDDDMRALLAPDTVPLYFEPRAWKPFTLPDQSPCQIPILWNPVKDETGGYVVRNGKGTVIAHMPPNSVYFDSVHTPLAQVESPAELAAFADNIDSFDLPFFADESYDSLAERGRKLYAETDLALVANLQLHFLAAGQILRGYENFMVDLLINKPLAHAFLERITEAYLQRCERYLSRLGDMIQVVVLNDDLGTQAGPMLSLESYKEMIWPYQKRLFAYVKSKTKAAILFHSCGSVSRFIPLLIEAGIDALNPIQVSAAEMDTKKLKQEFGKDLVFWGGGCDTQRVLTHGTPREVKEEVKRRIGDLAPGGGFVFTQVHNIQPDVPPANIVAMYEALGRSFPRKG